MSNLKQAQRSQEDHKVAKIIEKGTRGTDDTAGILASIRRYEKLQRCLDSALPDCMVTIPTKQGSAAFRTKKYWNAVALALKIDVALVSEERFFQEVIIANNPCSSSTLIN